MMPDRPWIPWKRWWTPLGGPIHLEQAGGFLSDPVSEFSHFHPLNVFPLDVLVQRHCLVLHGDPAMGKTAELDELEARLAVLSNTPPVLRVDFRSCLDGGDFHKKVFESARWIEWQQSDGFLRLIIDGVDEGLWLAPNFLEWFVDELKTGVALEYSIGPKRPASHMSQSFPFTQVKFASLEIREWPLRPLRSSAKAVVFHVPNLSLAQV